MNGDWQPYREPVRATLARTGAIAVILGAVWARVSGGGMRSWPATTLLMLWPALGGHFVELFFLNWLRPRLPAGRGVQLVARIVTWFAGGCVLAVGIYLTAEVVDGLHPARGAIWWVAGIGFIGIELIAHLALVMRGRNNFYNGRG